MKQCHAHILAIEPFGRTHANYFVLKQVLYLLPSLMGELDCLKLMPLK